jgi:hypothetical protein
MEGTETKEPAPRASERFMLPLLISITLGLLAVWNILPMLSGSHRPKYIGVVNNLKHIQVAKEQWALDHGVTGSVEVSAQNLGAYLGPYFVSNDLVKPILGERYIINPIGVDPEARLVRQADKLPAGTIIRLYPTGTPRSNIVLPGQAGGSMATSPPFQETNRNALPPEASR